VYGVTPDEKLAREVQRAALHIAIDGPAGAGKSTVGEQLAKRLRCLYLDTGMMYRAVTSRALAEGIDTADQQRLTDLARSTCFDFDPISQRLTIGGVSPSGELRTPGVDAAVSEVSAHPNLRAQMVRRQRELATGRSMIMIGRDIGTVVLPQAPVKLWISASPEERAHRRQREIPEGEAVSETVDIMQQLTRRDAVDATRAASPLLRATDAVGIETDGMTASDVVEVALEIVRSALPRVVCG
jgi:CMP/dCMP kinase